MFMSEHALSIVTAGQDVGSDSLCEIINGNRGFVDGECVNMAIRGSIHIC